jgi:hypothetical protein
VLPLVSDEDVHGDIVRGLPRRAQALGLDLDFVRALDVGLGGTPDTVILEWAAQAGRVLITNDKSTMVGSALARVAAGQPMAGLLALRNRATIGQAIDDILLVAQCYSEEDMSNNPVVYIPL